MIFAQTLMMVKRIELYRKLGRGGPLNGMSACRDQCFSFEMEANEAPSVINSFTLVSLVLSCKPLRIIFEQI